MKHTLRAKYAADGLTAHHQRLTAQPAVVKAVKAMKDKATLARITARLKSSGPKSIEFPSTPPQDDFRKAAIANLSKWYADYMDKEVFKALTAANPTAKPAATAAEIVARIKGRSADFIIVDDVGHDDKFDAMTWAPPRRGLSYGFDFAKPDVKDFGVVMVNATC